MVLLLAACKPQVPGKYIQPDEMEDLLYDYHIAMGMVPGDEDGYTERLYEASVLERHGVSKADFDSSLVYYSRHADRFQKIYENVEKRLTDEASSLGISVDGLAQLGEDGTMGDTTNVWNKPASCVLTTKMPNNVISFTLKADTTYHKGDRLIFSFRTQFIFQDGNRDARALMAVRFGNDSVVVRNVRISASNRYDLTIQDEKALGIKEIKGFICLQSPTNASESTLKMMFVEGIKLVRCHTDKASGASVATGSATKDSLATTDSTVNNANINEKKAATSAPHPNAANRQRMIGAPNNAMPPKKLGDIKKLN